MSLNCVTAGVQICGLDLERCWAHTSFRSGGRKGGDRTLSLFPLPVRPVLLSIPITVGKTYGHTGAPGLSRAPARASRKTAHVAALSLDMPVSGPTLEWLWAAWHPRTGWGGESQDLLSMMTVHKHVVGRAPGKLPLT